MAGLRCLAYIIHSVWCNARSSAAVTEPAALPLFQMDFKFCFDCLNSPFHKDKLYVLLSLKLYNNERQTIRITLGCIGQVCYMYRTTNFTPVLQCCQ